MHTKACTKHISFTHWPWQRTMTRPSTTKIPKATYIACHTLGSRWMSALTQIDIGHLHKDNNA